MSYSIGPVTDTLHKARRDALNRAIRDAINTKAIRDNVTHHAILSMMDESRQIANALLPKEATKLTNERVREHALILSNALAKIANDTSL